MDKEDVRKERLDGINTETSRLQGEIDVYEARLADLRLKLAVLVEERKAVTGMDLRGVL